MTDPGNEFTPDTLQVNLDRPSTARIYDYVLDNESPNNYAMDRTFADRYIAALPDAQKAARENRRFVGRVVETALEMGVRQFVDLGAGLPSKGQPHEVADRAAPDAKARVVYVDNELIANAHATNLLADKADPERHQAVLADFFNHGDLWNKVDATGLIDRDQPVCLLVTAVLHFMGDDYDPAYALRWHRSKLKAGSLLAISHVGDSEDEALQSVARAYAKTTNPATLRSDEQIQTFFGDWELLKPGLTWNGLWRPKTDRSEEPWWEVDSGFDGNPWWGDRPARMLYRAGVAMKH